MTEPTSTFLQIDLQNLFFEAKKKEQRIDFEKIWGYFNSRETEYLVGANVYCIQSWGFNSAKFEAKLANIGYKVKVKEGDSRNQYKQPSHNINMTIDCIEKLDYFQKWILMSGDGDFSDLCKFLKNHGKKIEIWSYRESYSSSLESYADKFYFIDDGEFYFKRPKIAVFGFNWGPEQNIGEDQ